MRYGVFLLFLAVGFGLMSGVCAGAEAYPGWPELQELRYGDALARAESRLQDDPTDSLAGLVAVRSLQHLGDKEEMRSRLERLIETAPENPFLYVGLGEALIADDLEKAVDLWDTALDFGEDDPRVFRELAWSVLYSGYFQQVETILNEGEKLFPGNRDLGLVTCYLLSIHGEHAREGNLYQHLARQHPDDPEVLARYALSFLALQQPDRTREILESIADPGEVKGLVSLVWAVYYHVAKERELVEGALRQALESYLEIHDLHLALSTASRLCQAKRIHDGCPEFQESFRLFCDFFPGFKSLEVR